jgi:four helix bundle protein
MAISYQRSVHNAKKMDEGKQLSAVSSQELGRFLQIALGSASELEYHLLLSHDLNFLSEKDYDHLFTQVTEVKRMLTGLIKKLKADSRVLRADG